MYKNCYELLHLESSHCLNESIKDDNKIQKLTVFLLEVKKV